MYPITNYKRFMLAGLVPPRQDKEKTLADFEETQSLVHTYGGRVFAAVSQNSTRSDHETFIGHGKAQEISEVLNDNAIDVVVINGNLKPGQLFALQKIFEEKRPVIRVWDRIDLILEIFARHASTAEAKLQIKIAAMRHMGPRIYGMGMVLSQQAGGIGTRGIGETNTELMKRHWRNEMGKVRKQLAKIQKNRTQQIDRRKRDGLSSISIVGYTNAGKTTLFNALTGERQLVDDALFVTLDSNITKLYLSKIQKEVYLSDTIGFINDLPPELIDAFKSTLMETIHADIILHVIDSSDPWLYDKIDTVEQIMGGLDVDAKRILYVFNKTDRAMFLNREALKEKYARYSPQFISALGGIGISDLKNAIQKSI